MIGKMKRRTVYVATVAAVLAMVGGFAMASLISTISSGGQNGYNVQAPGNTMYGGGSQSTNLVFTTAPGCTSSGGSVNPSSGTLTADVYVSGPASCQTSTADWFEEISFTSIAVPSATPSDVFTITVGANSPVTVTVTYSGLTSGTSIVTTNVFYELGMSGTAGTCDIGITGS
jgi:hypothetical protein